MSKTIYSLKINASLSYAAGPLKAIVLCLCLTRAMRKWKSGSLLVAINKRLKSMSRKRSALVTPAHVQRVEELLAEVKTLFFLRFGTSVEDGDKS